MEDISHFLFACPKLEDEWATFWYILKEKVSNADNLEKNILLHFIENLEKHTTARLLLVGLSLPFNSRIADYISKFVAVSIRKVYRIGQNMIREVLSSWSKATAVILTFLFFFLYYHIFLCKRNEMFEMMMMIVIHV